MPKDITKHIKKSLEIRYRRNFSFDAKSIPKWRQHWCKRWLNFCANKCSETCLENYQTTLVCERVDPVRKKYISVFKVSPIGCRTMEINKTIATDTWQSLKNWWWKKWWKKHRRQPGAKKFKIHQKYCEKTYENTSRKMMQKWSAKKLWAWRGLGPRGRKR